MPSPEASRRNIEKANKKYRELLEASKGDMDAKVRHSLELAMLSEIDTDDAKAVEQRTIEFFQICAKNNMTPILETWATALGVDRTTIINWRNGSRKKGADVLRVLNRYNSILNAVHAQSMDNGEGNAVMKIFLMKNNFDNYRDAQEINVMATTTEIADKQELADKYSDTIDAIDVDFTDVE